MNLNFTTIPILSFFIILVCSCTINSKTEKISDQIDFNKPKYDQVDYTNHFSSFKQSYLNSVDVQTVRLQHENNLYLQSLIQKIKKNNELFFLNEDEKIEFFVINDKRAFHFSLPENYIFISSGLLTKFINNENILISLLAYELIRIEKKAYGKNTIIPIGYLSTEKLVSIMRLKTDEKVTIHKWAYYLLKRANLNQELYLSWIQLQNRNSNEFNLMFTNAGSISREETLFKSFLIDNISNNARAQVINSSKEFYRLINLVKRRSEI